MTSFNKQFSPAELLKKFGTNKEKPSFKNDYVNDLIDGKNDVRYREHCFNRITYNQFSKYNKAYA